MNDDKPTHQPDRADKSCDEEEEDLATEQMKSMKGRKHSRGRERKEYEEITERQERTEKRGRKKVRHKNEKERRAFWIMLNILADFSQTIGPIISSHSFTRPFSLEKCCVKIEAED